jgi:quercetin dioxygenase-like cupin family protein
VDVVAQRLFLQEVGSNKYKLTELLDQRRTLPRVWSGHTDYDAFSEGYMASDPSKESFTEWVISPEEEPLRTQSLQVHYKRLSPGGSNTGHGHQNEAAFYIISGNGYEIHDGKRYDWQTGDFCFVHADSVHRHYNADEAEPAVALVIKAKSTWMAMGLYQQGGIEPWDDSPEGYGPRVDWSQLWTPGSQERSKVVRSPDLPWESTEDGLVKTICSPRTTDVRSFGLDLQMLRVRPGGRTALHWHMSDEYLYVIQGQGRTRQWDVSMELDDKYYAHVAKKPVEADFAVDHHIYVPPNTQHVFENTGGDDVVLMSAQNRLFKHMGYDKTVILEPAQGGHDKA